MQVCDQVQVCFGFRAVGSWLLWLRTPGPSWVGCPFFHFSKGSTVSKGLEKHRLLDSGQQIRWGPGTPNLASSLVMPLLLLAASAGLKIRELAFPFGGGERSREEGQDFMLRVLL